VLIRKLIIAAVPIVALLYVGRGTMARYLPGLPAFYSMKGEIFTYERTYTTGKVGPFLMGEPREKALMAIESGHSDDLIEVQISKTPFAAEFRPPPSLREADRHYLATAQQWRFASRSLGVRIAYRLTFKRNKLTAIKLTASLVS
jgi:hypothetical protein